MNRRESVSWGGARIVLSAIFLSASGIVGAQTLEPVWALHSDGSWQADSVSMGGEGAEVFSEYGSYLNARVLLSTHDANPPTPVWIDGGTQLNHSRRVDSAALGGVHVSLHQEYTSDALTWLRPVLRKYSTSTDVPDWIHYSNILIAGHDRADVRVSADGSRIVSVVYDSSTNSTVLSVFGSASSTPVNEWSVSTSGAFRAFEISGDGRKIVLRSELKLIIVDLDSGESLLTKYYFSSPFTGGIGISGDGATVAMASAQELHVFSWTGTEYPAPGVFSLEASSYTPSLAVSTDGSTIALASNFYSAPSNVRVTMLSTANLVASFDQLLTGSGSVANRAGTVKLSWDGGIAAVGLWGDGGGTIPELLVIDRQSGEISATADLPGSVMALDLSPNGDRVVVAAKGSHATEFGGGGGLFLFETCSSDFRLVGAPCLGSTVSFEQTVTPGTIARVVASPMLAAVPRIFDGVGTLYLDATQLNFVHEFTEAGADGLVQTPVTIGNNPALIGTTIYYQGFGLSPRVLTEDTVRMTVLP
ncbi:MAG: hypothetical protein ACI8X5_003097 [Planctomycetota bacterium]|jgi:hypothetical protein